MNFKSLFPFFKSKNGKHLVYLDSAATAQKFAAVIKAEKDFYENSNANVLRGLYSLSEEATKIYESARSAAANFINAKHPEEIIFTSGTTASLNILAQSLGSKLQKDEEILLTIFEHHSNIVPWQMIAKKTGAVLKYLEKIEDLDKMLNEKTKIVSVTGLSNALGNILPIKKIVEKAHSFGALVCIDTAQLAAHFPIDVQNLDCDFLAFSGHKIYGPTGIGVLYGRKKLLENMEPVFGGGEMILEVHRENSTWNKLPYKFEAGTPPIAQAAGLKAAIQEIEKIGFFHIQKHEKEIFTYALNQLKKIPKLEISGNPQAGVISFNIKGIHPHDIAAILDQENIAIRAGQHCCMPLMDYLKIPATARISIGIYNEKQDIDRLIQGLKKVQEIFKI